MILYVIFLRDSPLLRLSTISLHLILGGLQYYSYLGLTDSNPKTRSTSLDLMVVTFFIQFLGAFVSSSCYWALLLVAVWGGWTLYRMFRPSSAMTEAHSTPTNTTTNEVSTEKKQRRAERRRQKRM